MGEGFLVNIGGWKGLGSGEERERDSEAGSVPRAVADHFVGGVGGAPGSDRQCLSLEVEECSSSVGEACTAGAKGTCGCFSLRCCCGSLSLLLTRLDVSGAGVLRISLCLRKKREYVVVVVCWGHLSRCDGALEAVRLGALRRLLSTCRGGDEFISLDMKVLPHPALVVF